MRSLLNQKIPSSDYINAVQALADRELFTHIAAGEEAALDELYKRYRTDVFRFLVHQTGDAEAAEELIQDVFLAAWVGSENFRGEAAVKTWLLRVAYYRAATWVKNLARSKDVALAESLPAGGVPLDQRIVQSWQTETIRRAMAELSRDHRTAVELIFYHELTYKEAAEVVSCPVGTMKSRVSHALKLLGGHLVRADLEDYDG